MICYVTLCPRGVRQRQAELFGNFVRPGSPERAADGRSRAEGGGLARAGRLEARSRRPRLGRLGGRCRAAAAAQRTEATGGGMDYLTTFTGKSGRLLRGTASRLWGLGGGGEARQVRFEDYLREPAPGDPGCGPAKLRPPSPASPEGPGESPRPRGASPPGARTGTGTGEAAPRAGVRARRCAGTRSRAAAWWPFLPRGRRHRLVPIQRVILPSPLPPPTSCDVHGVGLPERRVCAAFALISGFSWCEPAARAGVLTFQNKNKWYFVIGSASLLWEPT